MSEYLPPSNIEPISIFNPANFINLDNSITIDYANKHYLKFPVAQGNENLLAINVNGTANINSTLDVSGVSSLNNTVNITTSTNTNIQPSLKVQASNAGDYNINFIPRTGQGAYNPISQALDTLIFSNAPTMGTTSLVLTTHSSNHSGVRIAPTSTSIGAGANNIVATTEVKCDGTNVVVKPNLKFPDNTIQDSAFTGAGALAGSYTNTNLTLDSNGKITSISSSSGSFSLNSYTTAGAYTLLVPSGATRIRMWAIGAGASGGAGLWWGAPPPTTAHWIVGATSGGSGGLSYVETVIPAGITQFYINVGAGGLGVNGSATPTDGNNGGSSWIKTTNATGLYMIMATGGTAGRCAKITTTTGPNANLVGNGGTGNMGVGGQGAYSAYYDGTNMNTAGTGYKSSGLGSSSSGGNASMAWGGFSWNVKGNANNGGGVPQAVAGDINAGGGTSGYGGLAGSLPSASYKREMVGCAGSGGCDWAITATTIPNSPSLTGFWGVGSAGGGSYADHTGPPTFIGGNSGNGADGAIWVQFA